jgi:transcriptional regulator with XRE-family HTH domain
MNIPITTSKLFKELKDKEYRDLYVEALVDEGIPHQLRALRAARKFSQVELANLIDTKQAVISRIESKGAATLSIKTLLALASALDVALVVRFEPIDRVLTHMANLSPDDLAPKPSGKILASMENVKPKIVGVPQKPSMPRIILSIDDPNFRTSTVPFTGASNFQLNL